MPVDMNHILGAEKYCQQQPLQSRRRPARAKTDENIAPKCNEKSLPAKAGREAAGQAAGWADGHPNRKNIIPMFLNFAFLN